MPAPGIIGGAAGGVVEGPDPFVWVDDTTSAVWFPGVGSTLQIPVCPNVKAGNLLLVAFAQVSSNASSAITPSGWTREATGANRHTWFYKIADGTESGTTLGFGCNSTTPSQVGIMVRISGLFKATPVDHRGATALTNGNATLNAPNSSAVANAGKDLWLTNGNIVTGQDGEDFGSHSSARGNTLIKKVGYDDAVGSGSTCTSIRLVQIDALTSGSAGSLTFEQAISPARNKGATNLQVFAA